MAKTRSGKQWASNVGVKGNKGKGSAQQGNAEDGAQSTIETASSMPMKGGMGDASQEAEAATKVAAALPQHEDEELHKTPLIHGYGDYSMYVDNCRRWSENLPNINKNDQPFIELEGFIRGGNFPSFSKIPILVRKQIFELLCAPFFAKDPKTGFLEIELHRVRKLSKRAIEALSEDGAWIYEKTMLENVMQKKRYPERKSFYQVQVFPHPKRNATFVNHTDNKMIDIDDEGWCPLGLWIGMNTGMGNCCHDRNWALDIGMLKLIQTLSRVSHGFRNELASVLWAKTKINYCIGEGNILLNALQMKLMTESAVVNFLKERPLVCPGIRTLALNAVCMWSNWQAHRPSQEENIAMNGAKEVEFINTCQYITNAVPHLENLEIRLSLDESNMPDLLELNGLFVFLSALKTVLVSKSFKVILHIDAPRPDLEHFLEDEVEDEEMEQYRKERAVLEAELKEKWMRAVTEVLMPDSLKTAPVDLTDKGQYLTNRKKDQDMSKESDDWPYNFPLGEVQVMNFRRVLLMV